LFEETLVEVNNDSPTKRTRLATSSSSPTTENSDENNLTILEESFQQGVTSQDEFNIQELREENADLREKIKVLEERDKKNMEDLNELREENVTLRQQMKIQSECEKHKTNDLNRLREENAAHQQAYRMLEEEKLKILEKLKQRRKEKDASYSRFKQKKNETLRKKNLRPDSYDCNTSTNCSGDGDAD
jgi:chromosome segregation ATPase